MNVLNTIYGSITVNLNGCAPDALVRNAFVILRMVATARYLHLKSQELHEALMEAHGILGEDAGPAHEANARRVLDLRDQLSALVPYS
jgi:hypothetical protein